MPVQSRFRVIDYAVVTVARPKNYIYQLLANLQLDSTIRLMVGAPDSEYLDRYRNNPSIEIVAISAEEWEQFQGCSVHHRMAWNYWRSLTLGAGTPERDGLVIFEDDVLPARGWQSRLTETIEQIEARFGAHYVLALYRGRFPHGGGLYDWARTARAWLRRTYRTSYRGKQHDDYYAPYPAKQFYGTQAMYYPEQIRIAYAEYLKAQGVDAYRRPQDLLLKDYLQERRIPLFVTAPSLVQHIGEISTGVGWKFHKARQFQKNLESGGLRKRWFAK